MRQRYLQLHGTEGTDHGDVVDAVDAPSVAATSVTTEQCLDADWKEQALNEEKVQKSENKNFKYKNWKELICIPMYKG